MKILPFPAFYLAVLNSLHKNVYGCVDNTKNAYQVGNNMRSKRELQHFLLYFFLFSKFSTTVEFIF